MLARLLSLGKCQPSSRLLNPFIIRVTVQLRVLALQQCVRDKHNQSRYSRSLVVAGRPTTGGSMSLKPIARSPNKKETMMHVCPVACCPDIGNGARYPVAGRCRWPPCQGMPQLCLSCSTDKAVAEWLRAWDTLTMFEATVCWRS